MFTRSKLRKILSKYRKEFEKDFFRKNQIQQTQEHMLTESIQNKYIVKDLSENSENDDASLENNGKDNATVNRIELVKAQNFINDKRKLNNIHPEKNFDANIKDYKNLDIFHRAVWPDDRISFQLNHFFFMDANDQVMLLGQCFAVMPIVGIYHYNPRRMYFAFKSIQMLVTAIFLVASSLLTCSMTKYLMKVGVNAKNFVGFVFFATAQLACVLFLSLAKRWPRLIQYWTRTELIFTHPPYEELKRNLKTRVRLAAFLLICFSLFEHMLYLISAVLSYKRRAQICATAHNVSGHISFDTFIQSNYDYVFRTFNYNKFVGVFILMVNGACTFIWNYMDLFIMMVSKGIAYRFEQITLRIKKIADKDISENVFVEIREHYVKVCELLDYVDENLSGIILLSCVNNLYFVCYQLLNIFNKLRWPINYIYFWYSLLFLIGRTAFVFLTAAAINDQSKGALGTLRCVSNKTWCIEIERLIFQMTTQTVALSGKKFYFLTRRLLFGMAGTIITYELVLLQFDEPNRSKGLTPLCD